MGKKTLKKNDLIILACMILFIAVAVFLYLLGGEGGKSDTGGGFSTLSDFNGRKVGVQTGTVFDEIVKESIPDAEILYYNSHPDMMTAIDTGTIDGIAGEEPTIKQMMAADGRLDYIHEYMTEYDFGFVFKKDDEGKRLCDDFSAFLQELGDNGHLEELQGIWFGSDESKKVAPDIDSLSGENGSISLACEALNIPFVYLLDGKYAGYELQLAYEYCKDRGLALIVSDMDFGSIIPAVTSGKDDFGCSSITITEERAESVNFSTPDYEGGVVMGIRASDAVGAETEVTEKKTPLEAIASSIEKNFITESRYKLILEGIFTTCLITVLSAIFGSLLAFLICVFRRLDSALAVPIANAFVKLMQGTPIVVLLLILYYVVFGHSSIDALWVSVLGFSLNFGAFVSEILRAGIESIDTGQREAALALGFSESQAFYKFIFPQAAMRQLPVFKNEIVTLLKNTSVVGYLAIQDLTKMSDIIRSRTYEAFFPLIMSAVLYFILAWILSCVVKLVFKAFDPRTKKRELGEVVK